MDLAEFLNPVTFVPILSSVIALILMSRKIYLSKDKLFVKFIAIIFIPITMVVVWYLMSFASYFVFARLTPQNEQIPCFMLSESACRGRFRRDCTLSAPVGSGSRCVNNVIFENRGVYWDMDEVEEER